MHCLNRAAAQIWRHCDGATTTAELAERAAAALEVPITEEIVWHALDQLAEFHLLEAQDTALAAREYVTRREAIAELSGMVGLALPLVVSITTPVAAQTGSTLLGGPGPSGPSGPSGPTGPSGPSGPS